MKIAIVGYGLMGHEIEALAGEAGDIEVATIQCRHPGDPLDPEALGQADVAIDFSAGELMVDHVRTYAQVGIDAVIGTTSWDSHDPQVRRLVEDSGIGVIVGENFSPGAQVFLRIVAEATRRISSLEGYDIFGLELHHAAKLRAPSGTAEAMARAVLASTDAKASVSYNAADGHADPSVLRIASVRGGRHPGLHEIVFDSAGDEIRIVHEAHTRRAFAAGALLAARRIEPGFHRFEDLFV